MPLSHDRGRRSKPRGRKKRDNPGVGKSKQTFRERLISLMLEHQPPVVDGRSGEPTAMALSRFTGLNRQTLENYLKGRVPNIAAKNLFHIANRFGVSKDWLWEGIGPKEREVSMNEEAKELLNLFVKIKSAISRAMVLDLAKHLHSIEDKGNKNS